MSSSRSASSDDNRPNASQADYWNESAGPTWVRLQEQLDAQIEPHGRVALDRAAPRAGETAIDIGCGCGQTSLELARRVGASGRVLGVDLSEPMLERARQRAREAGLEPQLSFLRADAQTHAFEPGAADLLFSRFGVMFFEDPLAAFRNLFAALRPGGRLVFLCWRGLDRNPWMRVPIMAIAPLIELPPPPAPGEPGPMAFADGERVCGLLSEAGFEAARATAHESEVAIGGLGSPESAAEFLLRIGPASRAVRESGIEDVTPLRDAIARALGDHLRAGKVVLDASMWIFEARRPLGDSPDRD